MDAVSGMLGQVDWKLLAQVFSGGLAGATITFLLNQIAARRKLPRISVSTSRTDYSIPSRDTELRPVQVSYAGATFEKLLLYEFTVRNDSTRTATTLPFLFFLPRDARVVDRSCATYPIKRPDKWEEQATAPGIYSWDPGELKPSDYSVLRILLTPAGTIDWKFRGDDDARIVTEGPDTAADLEVDTRLILAWVALFILAGELPVGDAFFRAVMVWTATPFVVNRISQWHGVLLRVRNRGLGSIDVSMQDVTVEGGIIIESRRT